jgi:HEAT repeats
MRAAIAILAVALAVDASAQPRVSNGQVQAAPVAGRFTRAMLDSLATKPGTTWVGYAVPAIDGEHDMCCWNSDSSGCCQSCRLEPGATSSVTIAGGGGSGTVALEGQTLHVLYRLDTGRVDRIRTFSEGCALDAGGLTLQWMTGVAPGDSAAVLGSFLVESSPGKLADGALTALAMHREAAALERLLSAARDGATAHLRGQALFWLGQRAGDKAVGAITDAIARDPETTVKTRAVFALSQLPKDEGVPLLIQVARTHSNPAVKKQAMFWLGQSNDPRALKFFEEILFK